MGVRGRSSKEVQEVCLPGDEGLPVRSISKHLTTEGSGRGKRRGKKGRGKEERRKRRKRGARREEKGRFLVTFPLL